MVDIIPLGLAILRDQSIFMTVKDWPGSIGQGLNAFEDAFTTVPEQDAFKLAVRNKTGLELVDVLGNLVVSEADANSSTVPERPAVCAFRMARGGAYFVARNFRDLGVARGQEFSVLAIMDDSTDLLNKYPAAYGAADEDPPKPVIAYDDLRGANLIPVYSSLTITKPALEGNDGGDAAGYGDGAL